MNSLKQVPLRVAGAYVIIAAGWIAFSDTILNWLVSDQDLVAHFQWAKGIGFVAVTGLVLYAYLWRECGKRAAMQSALEHSAHDYRNLVDLAKDAIFSLSPEGKMVSLNPAFERITGKRRQDWVGRDCADLLVEEDRPIAIATLRRALANADVPMVVVRVNSAHRGVVTTEVTLAPRIEAGRVMGIQGIARDVTARKSLEAQLIQAQRLENIGKLAGGIAHDLNNILAPILMAVEILAEHTRDPEVLRLMNTVQGSASRGAEVVKQILAFVRGGQAEKLFVNLKYPVKEIAALMRETFPKSISVRVEVQPDVWPIEADPAQIYQVLLNLCVNARDAMPEGGRLVVELSNAQPGELAGESEASNGPHVRLRVTDTGMGIPKEHREKIFEPLFTTKEPGKGTGLGLSTVRAIVKGHNGRCLVQSEPGHGTTFCIYLPAAPQATMKVLSPDADAAPLGQGELVLLVDDEKPFLELTAVVLERYGYRVLKAMDGVEAIGKFVEYRDQIRLLVTDLDMPLMGGRALILAIRRLAPHMRVLIVSGDPSSLHEEIGNADSLAKPFGPAQFAGAVRKLIRSGTDTERLEKQPAVLLGNPPIG